MKEVTYACRHTGTVEDTVKTSGGMMMEICPRCLAVQSVGDLFIGYPSIYKLRSGKGVMAAIKSIEGDTVVVSTNHVTGIAYQEWTVNRSDFHKQGLLFVADPFNTMR